MHVLGELWRSTVGKKALVAVSGLVLWTWVVLHVLGNLMMFSGAAAIDGYAAALHRGYAFARAGLRIGQPLAREDEQRPAHREVLHERPIEVQRPLEIGHRHAFDAGLRGQEDRRRVGAVQADHAAGRLDDVGGAVRAGQTVTPGDPGSTLGNGETAWCGHAARS
jgi:hypothetical protein